jgi:hypothetical protein
MRMLHLFGLTFFQAFLSSACCKYFFLTFTIFRLQKWIGRPPRKCWRLWETERARGPLGSWEWAVPSVLLLLVAGGWCWFAVREKDCWLVAGGWFVLREKYCCLVADKPKEQAVWHGSCVGAWNRANASVYENSEALAVSVGSDIQTLAAPYTYYISYHMWEICVSHVTLFNTAHVWVKTIFFTLLHGSYHPYLSEKDRYVRIGRLTLIT